MVGDLGHGDHAQDADDDGGDDRPGRRVVPLEQPLQFRDVGAVLGYQQPGERVEQQADTAEDGERGQHDAKDDRVDADVAAEACADTADHPVVAGAT